MCVCVCMCVFKSSLTELQGVESFSGGWVTGIVLGTALPTTTHEQPSPATLICMTLHF